MKQVLIILILSSCGALLNGQQTTHYDLAQMFGQNQLAGQRGRNLQVLSDKKDGVSTNGIVWLQGVSFNEGTIDIDLRGKNIFLKSFLGIAFHAVDTLAYETIYF